MTLISSSRQNDVVVGVACSQPGPHPAAWVLERSAATMLKVESVSSPAANHGDALVPVWF